MKEERGLSQELNEGEGSVSNRVSMRREVTVLLLYRRDNAPVKWNTR